MENIINILFDPTNQIYQIVIALFLGIFLGLRKEMSIQKDKKEAIFGLRTISLIVILGTISTFFTTLPFLPVIFFLAIFSFIIIAYYNGVFKLSLIGLTSEIQALIAFWIGVLIGYEKILIAIILTVTLSIFETYKHNFHKFAKDFSFKEYSGSLKLIIITCVILPFLPTQPVDKWGIFIPFNVWLIVVFISAIGFLGYFLNKYFGSKRSILLTSFLGSIVSSTAVTTSLSSKSKETNLDILKTGLVLAIFIMQTRVLILILIMLFSYFEFDYIFIVPSIGMIISSGIIFVYYYLKTKDIKKEDLSTDNIEVKSPFEIAPALKFTIFFVFVLFATYFGNKYFGQIGGYFVVFLASFTDADAIILSTIETFKMGGVTGHFMAYTILIAIVLNTIVKSFYIFYIGGFPIFKKTLFSVSVISILGLLSFYAFI